MADPAEEKDQKTEAAPAAPPIQDFEQRMDARMREFEDRMFSRVAQFVNPAQQRSAQAEPEIVEVSEEEIEAALEAGDSKKAAKLLRRQQQAELSRMEQRFSGKLGEATRLVADRLTKFSQRTAKELPYYERFGKEINSLIAERQLDATDPEVLKTVHDLVSAQHMQEIIREEVEKTRRTALEEGEEEGFKKSGVRRRRGPSAGEQEEYRQVPVTDDLMDELEDMGFSDADEFARKRGFEDPTGKGQHWNYMHAVGRRREREVTRGAGRTKQGMANFIGRLKNQREFYEGRKEEKKLARLQQNA